jgi:hypothetical protein
MSRRAARSIRARPRSSTRRPSANLSTTASASRGPRPTRHREHGAAPAELLDAGEASTLAFVGESGSLLIGGLRARRSATARVGARRLLADACCQAVLILLALWFVSAVTSEAIIGPSGQLFAQEAVISALLVCALAGFERAAALAALTAMAAFSPLRQHPQLVAAAKILVPVGCLLVMALASRRRPPSPRRLLWLAPIAALAAAGACAQLTPADALALISIPAVLRLLHDPRPAIACGLDWAFVLAHAARPGGAAQGAVAIGVVALAGLVLAAAARGVLRPVR